MSEYILDYGEVVILQEYDAIAGSVAVNLTLTNQNIIQVIKNKFGASKSFEKYPLTDIREHNGKPNVIVSKNSNGEVCLNIFFENSKKSYVLKGLFTEKKWADAITKAYKERISELAKIDRANNPNNGILNSVIKGLNIAKASVLPKTPGTVTVKCTMCGAEISGERGQEAQCSYCQNFITIR